MKHSLKHKLFQGFAVVGILASLVAVGLPTSVFAAANPTPPPNPCANPNDSSFTSACCPAKQVAVSIQGSHSCCPESAVQDNPGSGESSVAKACFFGKYLNPLINLLSAVVGVVVVIGVIVGAIQFSSSAGDPQKAANGKNHIRNALLGLLAYLLLFAFLQFMVPGGLLSNG